MAIIAARRQIFWYVIGLETNIDEFSVPFHHFLTTVDEKFIGNF